MTEEELKNIEFYSSRLRSPGEICLILGLNFIKMRERFINPEDAIYKAYHTGKQLTIVKHVDIIIKLAGEGSSAAQSMLENIIVELQTKEADELT